MQSMTTHVVQCYQERLLTEITLQLLLRQWLKLQRAQRNLSITRDGSISISYSLRMILQMRFAIGAAHSLDAKAIIVLTRSGKTAWALSSYRPACPIIAATVSERAARQLNLAWGVVPVKSEEVDSADKLFEYAVEKAVETEELAEGDLVVIVAGGSLQEGAPADMIKLKRITAADLNK